MTSTQTTIFGTEEATCAHCGRKAQHFRKLDGKLYGLACYRREKQRLYDETVFDPRVTMKQAAKNFMIISRALAAAVVKPFQVAREHDKANRDAECLFNPMFPNS